MKKRYVNLSESDILVLEDVKKNSTGERERDRAHALLLSNRGFDIPNLRSIFEVNRNTITDWFNRWEAEGISSLSDASRSGRPRIFSALEEKK